MGGVRRMEVDLQPVYDALAKMSARLDPSELLAAINRLRCRLAKKAQLRVCTDCTNVERLDVDYHHIGDIVAERAPRADNTEVLQFHYPWEELDVTPIMHSISSVKAGHERCGNFS
eukprot:5241926-Amphidinium_carterae.1